MSFWWYLLLMAGVTYFIRALPFVLCKKRIENRFLRSFLHYIPFTVLAVMTIPGALYAGGSFLSAGLGLCAAVLVALYKPNLTLVACVTCIFAFVVQLCIV